MKRSKIKNEIKLRKKFNQVWAKIKKLRKFLATYSITFILLHITFSSPKRRRTFLARFREILQNVPTLGGQSGRF